MKTGVYKITNSKNNKIYIGSSSRNIYKRWNAHLTELNRNVHANKILQNSFNLHGKDCFIFSVVEFVKEDLCLLREQYYINLLTPAYNICNIAGSRRGLKHSQETKNKISAKAKGRKYSDETKAKVSASLIGNKRKTGHTHTNEFKEGVSKRFKGFPSKRKGVPCTQEAKNNMKIAAKFKLPPAAETRAKLSAAFKGKKASPSKVLKNKIVNMKFTYIIQMPNGKRIKWILGLQEFYNNYKIHQTSLVNTLRGFDNRGRITLNTKGYKMLKKRFITASEFEAARLVFLAVA